MGSSSSTAAARNEEFLNVPLEPQTESMAVGIDAKYCRGEPTQLRYVQPQAMADKIWVIDALQNANVAQFVEKAWTLSNRRTLYEPSGQAIVHLRRGIFSRCWRVLEGENSDNALAEIRFTPKSTICSFTDKTTGEKARLVVEQSFKDLVALVHLERGSQRAVVGRVRRQGPEINIEVAAGVDLLLVLLVFYSRNWQERVLAEQERQRRARERREALERDARDRQNY